MLLVQKYLFLVAAGGSGGARSGTIREGGAYDGSSVTPGGPYGGSGKGIASDGSGGLTAGSAFANTGSGGGGNGNDNGNGEPGWGGSGGSGLVLIAYDSD